MSDEELLKELEQAIKGLLFMSESDYPFEIVHWAGLTEITPQYLKSLKVDTADSSIETTSVDNFFRAATTEREGQRAEDAATVKRYQRLLEVLKNNLEDLRVYKIGTINIPVYIVGKGSSGDWIGLSTRVVET
jgi:hypothetical protein